MFPRCRIPYFGGKKVTRSLYFIFKLRVLHKNQDAAYGCEQVYTFVPEFLNSQYLWSNICKPGWLPWGYWLTVAWTQSELCKLEWSLMWCFFLTMSILFEKIIERKKDICVWIQGKRLHRFLFISYPKNRVTPSQNIT